MSSLVALTRPVPDALARCELTHLSRVPIDVAIARRQHAAYETALVSLGCEVRHLPATPDLPDSVFVEDAAVVLDELAIVTRPGADSRRDETVSMANALSAYRRVRLLHEPATLDGGDVLRLGRVVYVGVGARTNADGGRQLAEMLDPYGYVVRIVQATGCLHLKSAITEVAPGLVLVNPAWIDPRTFDGCEAIEVDDGEPFAANALRVGGTVLCAAAHERTNRRLESAGLRVQPVDVSELAKAEAGVTCCSVLFSADSHP